MSGLVWIISGAAVGVAIEAATNRLTRRRRDTAEQFKRYRAGIGRATARATEETYGS